MKKFLKFLASIKLAVFVLIALASIIATGTFVEARYDAEIASKLVYRTPWMFAIMGLLAVNLIAVMYDRWPWKKRHIPFLAAHIGIITLMVGALITMKYGLDGSLRVPVGGSNRWLTIPVTDLTLWSSFDGDHYTKLYEHEVDFFMNPPKDHPLTLNTDVGPLQIYDYKPFALATKHVVSSENEKAGQGLRFQIQNPRVNVIEWLLQERPGEFVTHEFGPARVHLGTPPAGWTPAGNEIYLNPKANGAIEYTIMSKDHPTKKGLTHEGESFETGWMGLTFRVLRYLPRAESRWDFKDLQRPTELTTSAIAVDFQGKKYWVQKNDVLKFFSEKGVYILTYGSRRVDLGFDLHVKRFDVGHYQGTQRAASYASLVSVPGFGEQLISMNEPLKYKGKTVYQASFEESENGGPPRASVFSINQDPGRYIKYLGCLIICTGIVWMFYDRRKAARAMAPKTLVASKE